jgi:hypothetical protein
MVIVVVSAAWSLRQEAYRRPPGTYVFGELRIGWSRAVSSKFLFSYSAFSQNVYER